jgi:hypothetical protein
MKKYFDKFVNFHGNNAFSECEITKETKKKIFVFVYLSDYLISVWIVLEKYL